ncbi:MAG: ABC transporter substrate-binding protein, partial [Anaerolineae bacterium]
MTAPRYPLAAPSVLWLSSRGSRTPALRLPRTGAILLTPLLIAVAACAGLAGPKPGPPPASTSSDASALPPSTPTGAPSPAPRRGGTLRLPGRDPSTLDPALARDVSAAQYIYEIYSGLVSLRGDLAIVPDLATRWSRSGDGRTYTFTLRANARFHDGRPVTAADVVFSFERAC